MIFSVQEKIRFAHCDAAGIVFYPRYLEMLNALMEDWFEEALHASFQTMLPANGVPAVQVSIQYQSPATLGEVLTKELSVQKIGRSSLTANFRFMCAGRAVAMGKITLVYAARIQGKLSAQSWPDAMKLKMQPYLIS